MKKKFACLLGVGTLALSLMSVGRIEAAPQGSGNIDASFVRADRLVLDYTVQGNGRGTAEFACKLVSPEGKVFNQSKASSYWNDGKANAQFVFTGLTDSGYYSATCQWKPYGVGVIYKSILRP